MNTEKNIELELRAEVDCSKFGRFFNELKEKSESFTETERFFIVFFGEINDVRYDCRVRIINGQAEVVVKKGDYLAPNRTETIQAITRDQFMGFVKLFSQFDFNCYDAKVCYREVFDFRYENDIDISLGRTDNLCYIEVEKMTNKEGEEEDEKLLLDVFKELGIEPETKEKFLKFCKKLDKVDWFFDGSEEHYQRLEKELKQHKYEEGLS